MRMLKSRKLLSMSLVAAAAAGCAGAPPAPRAPVASATEFRAARPPAEPFANPNPSAAQGTTELAPSTELAPVATGFITASVDTPLLQANGRPACGNVMTKKDPKTGVTTTSVAQTECD